jgi:iron complex transport system permease protein
VFPDRGRIAPRLVLAGLAALAVAAAAAFLTLGARGSWSFVLAFRGEKLAALALVAYSVAVSTVLFQTVVGNRILTPSIMGFDDLFGLLQTVMVFSLGARVLADMDPRLTFVVEVGIMVGLSLLLYRFLFSGFAASLHLMLLVGVFVGILFRSAAVFLQRIIDPTEFVVLQDRLFASFNAVDGTLLGAAAAMTAAASLAALRFFHRFDVMALGRETAVALGVDHRRTALAVLALCAVLVSVSTALVGPVTFFGLLVANLAYVAMPTGRHRYILPAAALIAFVCLVGGQLVLERLFGFDTALSIVVEFAGGIVLIVMLMRGGAR